MSSSTSASWPRSRRTRHESGRSAPEVGSGQRGWRLQHLPVLLWVSAAVFVVATAAGWLAAGGVGAVGTAAGVGIVTFGYTVSTVVVAWADSVSPRLVLPFGMGMYVAKLTFLGGVMAFAASRQWPGLVPLSCGVVAGVVGWMAAQIWWVVRVHTPRRLMYLDS